MRRNLEFQELELLVNVESGLIDFKGLLNVTWSYSSVNLELADVLDGIDFVVNEAGDVADLDNFRASEFLFLPPLLELVFHI